MSPSISHDKWIKNHHPFCHRKEYIDGRTCKTGHYMKYIINITG